MTAGKLNYMGPSNQNYFYDLIKLYPENRLTLVQGFCSTCPLIFSAVAGSWSNYKLGRLELLKIRWWALLAHH